MLAKSIPLPAPTFTPIDRRHDAVHDETRLVAAHLSVHARVQASVMRSAGAGSGRSVVVLDGVAFRTTPATIRPSCCAGSITTSRRSARRP